MSSATVPNLVLAFVEDGSVCLFDSPAAAVREFEGIDVESNTVQFFDRSGRKLMADFLSPNRGGKVIGPVSWVQSGAYTLVQAPGPTEHSLVLALSKATHLEPNPWFNSLAELTSALGKNRTLAVDVSRLTPG